MSKPNFTTRSRTVTGSIRFSTDLESIWNEQGGKCALCGLTMDKSAEVDHVVPTSRGGANEPENWQWLHRTCNLLKNDRETGELFALISQIARHNNLA